MTRAVTALLLTAFVEAVPQTVAPAAAPLQPFDLHALQTVFSEIHAQPGPAAKARFDEIIARAQAVGDRLSEAYAQAGSAALNERAGRWGLAERGVREAAKLAASAGDPQFLGKVALWLAAEADHARRPARARSWSELSEGELRRNGGDPHRLAAAIRISLSNTGPSSGGASESRLEEIVHLAQQSNDPVLAAAAQVEWGGLLRRKGDLGGAIRKLEEASSVLQKLAAWREAARALTLLARARVAHGRSTDALAHLQKAAALIEQHSADDRAQAIEIRIEMGRILALQGHRKQAGGLLDQARLDFESSPSGPASLVALTSGFLHLSEYAKAAEIAEAGLRRYGNGNLSINNALLSCAYFHLGRYPESIDIATAGLARARRGDVMARLSAYRWRARSLDRLGRSIEAAQDVLEAARLGDAVLGHLTPDDDMRLSFTDARQEFADDLIAILSRAGKHVEALGVAETFRARAFIDLLAGRDVAGDPGSALAIPPKPEQLVNYTAASQSPLLSYWVHPNGVYIWLIQGQRAIHPLHVPVALKRLQNLVARARQFAYQPDLPAWRELHRILIQPLLPKLEPVRSRPLTILAHGPLLDLPFGALLAPSGRFLLQDYALRVVPAAGLLFRTPAPAAGGPFLLVGAPRNMPAAPGGQALSSLPGAQRELSRAAILAGVGRVLLSGKDALAARVLTELPQARVAHFATHAIVDTEQPAASFLALSEGGKLTAGDLYKMRIGADLVLLTACRSGSGRLASDGLIGFTRAFLHAGAASVIAPLWDIADEPTVRLVEEFYRHYRRGATKSAALRSAQLQLLEDLRARKVSVSTPAGPMTLPAHPSLWAGFILQGAD